MKYCNNCHRLSKDDDFCSHCGAAVYGDDEDHSANISCEDFEDGHSHEKVTYTSEYTTHQTKTPYNANRYGNTSSNTQATKKKSKGGFALFWILLIVSAFIIEIIGSIIEETG